MTKWGTTPLPHGVGLPSGGQWLPGRTRQPKRNQRQQRYLAPCHTSGLGCSRSRALSMIPRARYRLGGRTGCPQFRFLGRLTGLGRYSHRLGRLGFLGSLGGLSCLRRLGRFLSGCFLPARLAALSRTRQLPHTLGPVRLGSPLLCSQAGPRNRRWGCSRGVASGR